MDNNQWFAACEEAGIVENGHFILHGGAHTDKYVNFATLLSRRGELLDMFVREVAAHLRSPMPFVFVGTGNGAHFANLVVQAVHTWGKGDASIQALPRFAYASRFEPAGHLEFRRNQAAVVKNAPVVIIDDVLITGSTLGELEDLVWRSEGTLRGQLVLLNRTDQVITERAVRHAGVVPFNAVFQWSSKLWLKSEECPQCLAGVPINLEVGKGAAYHRLYGHPVVKS
jgi:orotate phosphoribosyltransferase